MQGAGARIVRASQDPAAGASGCRRPDVAVSGSPRAVDVWEAQSCAPSERGGTISQIVSTGAREDWGNDMTDTPTLASWLIVVGLICILAQVVISIITAAQARKAQNEVSTLSLGDFLKEILGKLVAAVPLGVLGFLLVLVGSIMGGHLSVDTLFPPAG